MFNGFLYMVVKIIFEKCVILILIYVVEMDINIDENGNLDNNFFIMGYV